MIAETEAAIESARASLEAEVDAMLAELSSDYEAAVVAQEAVIAAAVAAGDYEAAFEGIVELWSLRDAYDSARADVMAARAVAAAELREEADAAREDVRAMATIVDGIRIEWLASGCDEFGMF